MNTKLRKETKVDSEKDFFKLVNNSVYGKTMESVKKHRDIKLVTADKRRSYLASEPNYPTKSFTENLLAIEMKKIKVKMNKPVYLGLTILEIRKFWYNYMKPKYQNNVKLSYMDTDSFITNVKTEDIYKDICSDDEERLHRSLTTGLKKVIRKLN